MPCLGIFGLEFQNPIVTFEISHVEFVLLQNFVEKPNMSKTWTKNALFGCLLSRNFKKVWSYLK